MRRAALFRPFTPGELAYVTAVKDGQRDFASRELIVEAGRDDRALFTLFDGWAFRFKALPGGRRQILDLLLPGDLIGLQSPMTGTVRHSVAALTPVTVCHLRSGPVRSIFEDQPALGQGLMQTLLLDEDRADQRLLLLGRQRPTQRLAYLMLETHARLVARSMAADDDCDFPLTYDVMADALGLSRSQLARSLAELRDRGWAQLADAHLNFSGRGDMAQFCDYEPPPPIQRALI